MNESVRLGRIGGVDVGVNWGVFGHLPSASPVWGLWSAWYLRPGHHEPGEAGATHRWATTIVADIACGMEDVPVARPDEPLADLLAHMAGCTDGRALALDGERLVGIVSPSDGARQLEVADLRNTRRPEHV